MRFIHCADIHLDSPLRGLDVYDGAPAEEMRNATRRAFANVVDLAIDRLRTNQALRHQRTGWASLHALTAGHAGALAHRIAQVKHDLAMCTAHRVTNYVVDLLFTASTHAAITLYTGV